MAVKLGDAYVAIGSKDELDKGLNAARRKVNGFLNDLTAGIGQGIGQAVARGIGSVISNVMSEIPRATQAASDLTEAVNKAGVAFGDSTQEILDWSKTSATAFGQSRQGALEAASTFGLLFRTMGLTNEASADMSRQLVELASDLASINNISPEEALIKLRAGLVGEIEPLRTVGVLLNANVVEQKALALGLADTTSQLTEQDKVLARYQLILDQTTLAQGDFARTSDQLANAQRILAAQVEDTSSRFGQALLPIQLAFTRGLSELIRIVEPYGLNIMDSLAAGLARGITAILPVLAQVRSLFVYWLKPGSPPRLLKELTDWGRSAMQEYLHGWSLADFDALRSAGGLIERVVRSFAGSGDIDETNLVSRVFGTSRAMSEAVREFRNLGNISQSTLDRIAEAAGPAGREVSELVRRYFDLQRATESVGEAQDELNRITDRYARALNPVQNALDNVRAKQQEIRDNQRLEQLGEILRDPRAEASERQLARLEIEEIQLERQARAIESERDAAVDAAQDKIDAAKAEEDAKRTQYEVAQAALEQQERTNALLEEEANLRLRLANEALAAQEKAMREAEAAARAQAAEMERIADAQLRWRLATTDSEGQLAIWREELAKVAEGSAEYYDILTQIANLEERIAKERSKADGMGDLFAPVAEAVGDGGVVEQASEGIAALSAALEEAFKTLSGEQGTVELAPAWQNFADTLGTIRQAAEEAAPIIQSFIDLILGKEVQVDTGSDPFADNWWLSGFIPAINGIIENLATIRDHGWKDAWDSMVDEARKQLQQRLDEGDTEGAFIWEQIVEIAELITAFAEGDWKTAWGLLFGPPAEFFQGIADWFSKIPSWEETLRNFMERWGFPTNPFNQDSPPPGHGQDPLPFNPNASFPGILPQAPLMPAAAMSNTTNSNVFYIEQNIATNGDFGGARQGAAEGIRQALVERRLQGA